MKLAVDSVCIHDLSNGYNVPPVASSSRVQSYGIRSQFSLWWSNELSAPITLFICCYQEVARKGLFLELFSIQMYVLPQHARAWICQYFSMQWRQWRQSQLIGAHRCAKVASIEHATFGKLSIAPNVYVKQFVFDVHYPHQYYTIRAFIIILPASTPAFHLQLRCS